MLTAHAYDRFVAVLNGNVRAKGWSASVASVMQATAEKVARTVDVPAFRLEIGDTVTPNGEDDTVTVLDIDHDNEPGFVWVRTRTTGYTIREFRFGFAERVTVHHHPDF